MLVHLGAELAPPVQTLLVLLLAGASRDALTIGLGETQAWQAWGLLGKVKGLLLAEVIEEAHRTGQAEPPSLSKQSFVQASVHDTVLDLHVSGEVPLQGELARAVEAFEGLAVGVEVHVTHEVVHPVEFLPTKLAFIWLYVGVDDHMSLESLFLHETLEAHLALVGPYVGVDEHMALHVRQQGELAATDATLVLLHPFVSQCVLFQVM